MARVIMPSAPVVGVALKTIHTKAVINTSVAPAVGEIHIFQNGVYDVARYETAEVNVPIPSNYGLVTYNGSIITIS